MDDKDKAKKTGYNLVQHPQVYAAIQERLDEMYPDLTTHMVEKIKQILAQPMSFDAATTKTKQGLSVNEFIKVAEYLASIQGWKAPTRKQVLTADVSKLVKLPGMKE